MAMSETNNYNSQIGNVTSAGVCHIVISRAGLMPITIYDAVLKVRASSYLLWFLHVPNWYVVYVHVQ